MSPRELSLEEARALVPFSVLLPTLLPEGARLSGCLLAPDDPPGWLGLTYVIDPGARNSLHIQQGPSVASGAQDLVAWEHAMVDDVELRIQERGGEGFHTVEVFLTREGVPVLAHSDLDRGAVVAIALSLERA